MGRNLQIRVVAQTFRPEDILKDWPRLAHVAWRGELALPDGRKRGVMELACDLVDVLRFAAAPDVREALEKGAARAESIARALEAALGDWDAASANRLSVDLETALDELEALAPEQPFVVSRREQQR